MVIFHRFLYVYQGVNISYFLVLKKKKTLLRGFIQGAKKKQLLVAKKSVP